MALLKCWFFCSLFPLYPKATLEILIWQNFISVTCFTVFSLPFLLSFLSKTLLYYQLTSQSKSKISFSLVGGNGKSLILFVIGSRLWILSYELFLFCRIRNRSIMTRWLNGSKGVKIAQRLQPFCHSFSTFECLPSARCTIHWETLPLLFKSNENPYCDTLEYKLQ